MILSPNYASFQQVYYTIRLQAGTDPADALHKIRKTWKEVFPKGPFEYFFVDDYYDQQFRREVQFQRIRALRHLGKPGRRSKAPIMEGGWQKTAKGKI
jgi:putative ABC transport system permease protein